MRSLLYNILLPFTPIYDIQHKNKLRVLAYHTVPDKNFLEEQMVYLKKKYSIINLEQLNKYIYNGDRLPDNPILITFDDGDITVLNNGVPILKKYSIPAILFVITELIDTTKTFWWRRVEVVLQNEGKTYAEAREKVNKLKKVPETTRKKYLSNLEEVQSLQLKVQDLQSLSNDGIVIGNHTHTHPMVDQCTDEEIRKELKKTKEAFNKWKLTGYPFFAYPNGNWDEHSEKVLKEEGIELAFLFDHKVNKEKFNPLRISRIRVDADTELNEFKVKVSGLHPFLMSLKNKA